MRAFVLAGGLGNRLRPLTIVIPKPLVPVGEFSIIEILAKQLAAQGFDRMTIAVGHLASLIHAYCGDGKAWGIEIDYVHEDEPLGTAGCLSLVEDLTDDRVLVLNGDILTNVNFAEAYRAHDPADGATIFANQRSVAVDYGVLESDGDGYLAEYIEKPKLSYAVSMGIYVISANVISEFVPPGQRLDMPDLMRALMKSGRRVRVVPSDAYWLDLGAMDDLNAATERFNEDPSFFLP
ncbi:sugar phosphate nucleotidyltransferase [Sporichthya polymorpha]|uniref:sugar phosphate nucleotidyltransferase n=1 Tax=Sporichthya polymorpha TaxID=35751 RepID=UPI0003620365|nr:sugar phosphate nucleotidyltransferase [Sporichthya polymorpha]